MKLVDKLSAYLSNIWETVEEPPKEIEEEVILPPHVKEEPKKKFIFRPRTLDEYIGQDKAKSKIRLNLSKIRKIKPVHILIHGMAGHGKTTLAYVIVNELRACMYSVIGSNMTRALLFDFLKKNTIDEGKLYVLFIDEIHSMSKDMAEVLYPILEDFKHGEIELKPFIMIGATTEKATLVKKYHPLVDRCGCQIPLESYLKSDIGKILKQYSKQIYPEYKVSDKVIEVLAGSSKYIPRIAIAMLDDYIVCSNIDQVLSAHRIVYGSLTEMDISILLVLKENGKPIGQKNLATKAGIDAIDYIHIYEPFLLKQDYVSVVSGGREITKKGKAVLSRIGL